MLYSVVPLSSQCPSTTIADTLFFDKKSALTLRILRASGPIAELSKSKLISLRGDFAVAPISDDCSTAESFILEASAEESFFAVSCGIGVGAASCVCGVSLLTTDFLSAHPVKMVIQNVNKTNIAIHVRFF